MSYERVNAMERLPDAELEVMQALWRQEKYPVSSAALMEELAGRPPCSSSSPAWRSGAL